jgi:hypothetical protein
MPKPTLETKFDKSGDEMDPKRELNFDKLQNKSGKRHPKLNAKN